MPTNSLNQRYGNTSPKRQLKMQAEDAAIQAHPSYEKLHGHWKQLTVLERAVHVGRMGITFKNTVIARNLELDEGTIRKYRDIDKLSNYWKLCIAAHENYVDVLKAARLDPHPDAPEAEQPPSTDSTIQPAPSTEPTRDTGCAPAPTHSTAAIPQPSSPPASNKAELGQRQLRPVQRPKPKTGEQLQLEHKLENLRQKINFYRSPVLREQLEREYLEVERELAALADADPFKSPHSDRLAAVGDKFGGFFAARRAMIPSRKIKF